MFWNGEDDIDYTFIETSQLKHVYLTVFYPFDKGSKWERSVQQHVQQLIDCSPLLESFSLRIITNSVSPEAYCFVLDLQQNTRLNYVEFSVRFKETIEIVQNNQTKRYMYCKSGGSSRQDLLKKDSQADVGAHHTILYLPPTIYSLFIYNIQIIFNAL